MVKNENLPSDARSPTPDGLLVRKREDSDELLRTMMEPNKISRIRKFRYSTGGVKATTVSLLTATLGPGMLAYPDAFQRSGLAYSALQLLAIILLSYFSVLSLAESSDRTEMYTYGEICEATLSPKLKYLSEFFFYANNFGASVSYFVLINQNLNSIITLINDHVFQVPASLLDASALYWVTGTGLLLVPVVLMRYLKDLKFLSAFGLLSILYLAATIVVYAFVPGFYSVDKNLSRLEFVKLSGIVVSSSEMLYSYQSHQYISLAYKELKDNSIRRMKKVIIRQIFICSCIYLFVAVFGYITFADQSIASFSNFLSAYNLEECLPVTVGVFALTVSLVCSVPFCLRPCKESLFLFFKDLLDLDPDSLTVHRLFSLINLANTFLAAAACVYFKFSLNQLIAFVSTFTSPFMCFIFPFQFYIHSRTDEERAQQKKKIMAFNLLTAFFAVYWVYSLYVVTTEA